MTGGTAQPVLVDLPNVPSHGVAYLVNEFHASSRYSMLSAYREIDSDKYEVRFISPVNGEVFSAAGYEFHEKFSVNNEDVVYVYGGEK
jgi:hypothetical protein